MSNRFDAPDAGLLADLTAAAAPDLDEHQSVEAYRKVLACARRSLARRFRQGVPASALVHMSAAFIDTLLTKAWSTHHLPVDKGLALIAVGGYGRGELHPSSDIDLLILAGKGPGFGTQIQAFIAFLWDIGLEVGSSVRSVKDCVRESKKDITVATNLMRQMLSADCQG